MANLSSKTGTLTTPVQTQISLANNSTTSVQDMSAYDAQEVMGFCYLDATTDLRAYFKVTVVKNGAGTYEIAAADIAGDQSGTGGSAVAPIEFSMSGNILRVTVPNLTGFSSGYLRYQLSAPYLGGNYPLTVSARQVAGDVSGVAVPAGYIGEVRKSLITTPTNGTTSGTYFDASSISLPAGIWSVTAAVTFERNGVTFSSTNFVIGLNTTPGNSSAGFAGLANSYSSAATIPTSFTRHTLQLSNVIIRSDGTTLTLEANNTAYATGTTLYLKTFMDVYASGTPQYTCYLQAVRIA